MTPNPVATQIVAPELQSKRTETGRAIAKRIAEWAVTIPYRSVITPDLIHELMEQDELTELHSDEALEKLERGIRETCNIPYEDKTIFGGTAPFLEEEETDPLEDPHKWALSVADARSKLREAIDKAGHRAALLIDLNLNELLSSKGRSARLVDKDDRFGIIEYLDSGEESQVLLTEIVFVALDAQEEPAKTSKKPRAKRQKEESIMTIAVATSTEPEPFLVPLSALRKNDYFCGTAHGDLQRVKQINEVAGRVTSVVFEEVLGGAVRELEGTVVVNPLTPSQVEERLVNLKVAESNIVETSPLSNDGPAIEINAASVLDPGEALAAMEMLAAEITKKDEQIQALQTVIAGLHFAVKEREETIQALQVRVGELQQRPAAGVPLSPDLAGLLRKIAG